MFFFHKVANRYIATETKFARRSPCKLVQLLMTHSAEAFDSEQNVACTSSRRIIKLGNKPKNLRPSPAGGDALRQHRNSIRQKSPSSLLPRSASFVN